MTLTTNFNMFHPLQELIVSSIFLPVPISKAKHFSLPCVWILQNRERKQLIRCSAFLIQFGNLSYNDRNPFEAQKSSWLAFSLHNCNKKEVVPGNLEMKYYIIKSFGLKLNRYMFENFMPWLNDVNSEGFANIHNKE